ncbi:transcriptional regulator, TetR family [Rhizobiales bacterium GAS113]|nr:transcriptional regulator, TetR family [Rhizobiales bacterium GAS113]SEC49259.1 transcriptional regulator, TetR family [Rhizobiales bacterium GAS188]
MNEMERAKVRRKAPPKPMAVRSGRPPKELAGEVEQRILDAARKVFLDRGFEGASIEEIAQTARSGKPTIYARFPDKRALFTAVMMRDIVSRIERLEVDVPAGATVEERLATVGAALLRSALEHDRIELMRLAMAEALRFPDLSASLGRMVRERGSETGARLLAEIAQSDEIGGLAAFAPEHFATTTRLFLDLLIVPLILRALFGERPELLEAEVDPHVARSVAFFLAACRHDGVRHGGIS